MTVRMATRTALERDCSTLRRVGRMWRKCGDTSHVVIFICFCSDFCSDCSKEMFDIQVEYIRLAIFG